MLTEYSRNEALAFEQLFKLPVAEVKEISLRCHRPAKNHRKRCEALAMFVLHNYEKALDGWKPPTFAAFLNEWIKQTFGR